MNEEYAVGAKALWFRKQFSVAKIVWSSNLSGVNDSSKPHIFHESCTSHNLKMHLSIKISLQLKNTQTKTAVSRSLWLSCTVLYRCVVGDYYLENTWFLQSQCLAYFFRLIKIEFISIDPGVPQMQTPVGFMWEAKYKVENKDKKSSYVNFWKTLNSLK